METPELPSAVVKPRRVWLRLLKRVALALLVAVAVPAVRQAWHHYKVTTKLQETLAEIDRTEPGWRLDEIEAHREQIPDGENGARVVAEAGKLLSRDWPPKEIAEIINRARGNEPLEPDDLRRLTKELDAQRPALEEARKLSFRSKGRHHIEYARDILGTLLKDQSKVPSVTQLLLGDALRHDELANSHEALLSCRAAFNAGRSIGDEPLAVSQLIRNRSIVQSCRGIERALAEGEPPMEDLAELQKLLADEDGFPDLNVCARGERAAWQSLFEALESGDVSPSDRGDWEAALAGPIIRDRLREEHPLMLEVMNRWLAIASLPPEEQLQAEKLLHSAVDHLPDLATMTRSVMPAVAKVGDNSRNKHALLRCTMVALAAERYRKQRQRWPGSLKHLCPLFLPAEPRDPHDGEILRYRRLVDGVLIYSVGPDRVDNNGNLDPKNPNAPGKDIGIRLWDAAQRRQPPPENRKAK